MDGYYANPKDAERVKSCVRAGIVDVDRISRIINVPKKAIEKFYTYELGYTDDEDLAVVADTAFDMATSGKFPHMTQFWLRVKGGSAWRDDEPPAVASNAPIVIVMKNE